MSKFKKKRGRATPTISTASLPDIIFILLFFFMVVTVMKDPEQKLKIVVPEATELQKLERRSLVSHIYIGTPKSQYTAQLGSSFRIQLNDQIADLKDIPSFLENEKRAIMEQLHPFMKVSIRGDKEVTMGIISDVKTALRKSNSLVVNYSARRKVE